MRQNPLDTWPPKGPLGGSKAKEYPKNSGFASTFYRNTDYTTPFQKLGLVYKSLESGINMVETNDLIGAMDAEMTGSGVDPDDEMGDVIEEAMGDIVPGKITGPIDIPTGEPTLKDVKDALNQIPNVKLHGIFNDSYAAAEWLSKYLDKSKSVVECELVDEPNYTAGVKPDGKTHTQGQDFERLDQTDKETGDKPNSFELGKGKRKSDPKREELNGKFESRDLIKAMTEEGMEARRARIAAREEEEQKHGKDKDDRPMTQSGEEFKNWDGGRRSANKKPGANPNVF